MLTTPDEPSSSVAKMKHRATLNLGVLSGHYRMKDDSVTIVVQHQKLSKHGAPFKRNRRNAFDEDPIKEQTFNLVSCSRIPLTMF